jgi:putative membrane protein
MMYHWHNWGHGWAMGWMWLWWIVIIVALVAVFAYLARSSTWGRDSDSRRGRPSAEEILRERYARGEISKPQYEEQLKTLRGG